jgi:hypothetical protein
MTNATTENAVLKRKKFSTLANTIRQPRSSITSSPPAFA